MRTRRRSVFLLDSTYKTNLFRMPMLHGVSTTSTHHTFSAFVCFMRQEQESDYMWAIDCFRGICDANGISPDVIVTDRELALMNAIGRIFPEAGNLLCLWHINKNIAARFKALFSGEKWEVWIKQWKFATSMPTSEEFDAAIKDLFEREEYATPPAMQAYIEQTWLPLRTHFARAWTMRYRHLGHTVTSRVESAHSRLKGFISLSTGDLFTASQQIIAGHRAEIRDISETIYRQMQRVHPLYSNAIYRLVVNKVSWHALRLTAEQLRLARGCTTNPQPHRQASAQVRITTI